MTWTYNLSPGTASADERRDAVRVLIKDTVVTSAKLQDEEIAFFLAQSGNSVWRAAARACRALADAAASRISVGDLSIADQSIGYLDWAKSYDRQADMGATAFAGGISVTDRDNRDQDTDRIKPAFTRSLDRTPELDPNDTSSTAWRST